MNTHSAGAESGGGVEPATPHTHTLTHTHTHTHTHAHTLTHSHIHTHTHTHTTCNTHTHHTRTHTHSHTHTHTYTHAHTHTHTHTHIHTHTHTHTHTKHRSATFCAGYTTFSNISFLLETVGVLEQIQGSPPAFRTDHAQGHFPGRIGPGTQNTYDNTSLPSDPI